MTLMKPYQSDSFHREILVFCIEKAQVGLCDVKCCYFIEET